MRRRGGRDAVLVSVSIRVYPWLSLSLVDGFCGRGLQFLLQACGIPLQTIEEDLPRRLRVSTIAYLNTVPLTWTLRRDPPPNLDFHYTVPSQCAREIQTGRADIGIIPSIEYQRIPGLAVLSGPAIASLERVRSILLLTRKPIGEIRTVAADTSSRTSVALAQVLFRGRYGIEPAMSMVAPDPVIMLQEQDAAIVIGDPALAYSVHPIPGVQSYDLVGEWRAWTGLPFVFAFWAMPRDLATPELAAMFREARDAGVRAIGDFAPPEAHRRGLPVEVVLEYLTHNIHYHLDASCLAGLQRFYELAAEYHLIPRVAQLKVVEPGVSGALAAVQAPAAEGK